MLNLKIGERDANWWSVALYDGETICVPWKVRAFDNIIKAKDYAHSLEAFAEEEGFQIHGFTEELPPWRLYHD